MGFHAFLPWLVRPLLPLAADFVRLLAGFSGGLSQRGLQDLIALLCCCCGGIATLQCRFCLPCRLGCHAPVAGRANILQLQTANSALCRFFRRRCQQGAISYSFSQRIVFTGQHAQPHFIVCRFVCRLCNRFRRGQFAMPLQHQVVRQAFHHLLRRRCLHDGAG